MERRASLRPPDRSLVVLRVGHTFCALETHAVAGVVGAEGPLLPCAHPSHLVVGLREHRGALVPILDLRRWVGLVAEGGAASEKGRWVLVRSGEASFGVAADEVTGVFEAHLADARPVSFVREGSVVRAGFALNGATVLELDVGVLAAALSRGGSGDGAA